MSEDLVIYNNTEKNDDWMKSLDGYKDEVKLHDELASSLEKLAKADWQEQKHPRKKGGQFAPKGAGEAGGAKGKKAKAAYTAPKLPEKGFDMQAEFEIVQMAEMHGHPENSAWKDQYNKRHNAVESISAERKKVADNTMLDPNFKYSPRDPDHGHQNGAWVFTDPTNGDTSTYVLSNTSTDYIETMLNIGEHRRPYGYGESFGTKGEDVPKEPKPKKAKPQKPRVMPYDTGYFRQTERIMVEQAEAAHDPRADAWRVQYLNRTSAVDEAKKTFVPSELGGGTVYDFVGKLYMQGAKYGTKGMYGPPALVINAGTKKEQTFVMTQQEMINYSQTTYNVGNYSRDYGLGETLLTREEAKKYEWNESEKGAIKMGAPITDPKLGARYQKASDENEAGSYWKDQVATELSKRTGLDYGDVNQMVHTWAATSNDHNALSLALQQSAARVLGSSLSKWQRESIEKIQPAVDIANKYLATIPSKKAALKAESDALYAVEGVDKAKLDAARKDYERINQAQLRIEKEWDKLVSDDGPLHDELSWKSMTDFAEQVKTADPANLDKFVKAMYAHTQETLKGLGVKKGEMVTLYRGMATPGNSPNTGETVAYQGNAIESWATRYSVAANFGSTIFAIKIPAEDIVATAFSGVGCLNETEVVVKSGVTRMALVAKGAGYWKMQKAEPRVQWFYNNTLENDDWMKTLAGYQNEHKLHQRLALKGKKIKVVNKPAEQGNGQGYTEQG